ncbi:MAG: type II secretion system protein [Phycisphaerae bacterium]|jgi:prepilin-type N-terminal cleavage/methylation domain-containing protein/prepilin-type processing-associated H-X9-DG protein
MLDSRILKKSGDNLVKTANRAFTLVELLVVISIIALLMGILLPALNKARAYARAAKSMSNARQWGIGAIMFANDNDGYLPWEGNKDDYMGEDFKSDKWWANAIPPMLGQKSYRKLSEDAVKNHGYVPLPPQSNNIFIDPAAQFPGGFTTNAVCFYDNVYDYEYQLFFCYVWNSELNNGPTASAMDDIEQVKSEGIRRSSETVLMLEMRTTNDELDKTDYEYYRNRPLLGRHRGDWKRIARRHLNGSHIVFCDGHTERVKYDWATTNSQGSRDPDYPNGNWNKQGLIWNAFGPSLK